jgi:hypothetical protein
MFPRSMPHEMRGGFGKSSSLLPPSSPWGYFGRRRGGTRADFSVLVDRDFSIPRAGLNSTHSTLPAWTAARTSRSRPLRLEVPVLISTKTTLFTWPSQSPSKTTKSMGVPRKRTSLGLNLEFPHDLSSQSGVGFGLSSLPRFKRSRCELNVRPIARGEHLRLIQVAISQVDNFPSLIVNGSH